MRDSQKTALSKIVSDSMEKLAFMFFTQDVFREPVPFENAVTAEELARVLFHPHPRAHLQGQGQKDVTGLQRARL